MDISVLDPIADEAAARAALAWLDASARHHDVLHGGRTVRWRCFGAQSGAPMVLIHGGHGSWMHWVRNIEALAQAHAVWVPDMPGFLDSQMPDLPAGQLEGIEPVADALIATLDVLVGHGTAIGLAGFSFGGLVAAHLALRRGHVRRMALLGTTGHGSTRREIRPMIQWRIPDDPQAMRQALRHNLDVLMLHRPAGDDALALCIHELSCVGTRLRSRALSRAGGLEVALAPQTLPLLLMWGEHDVTGEPAELVRRFVKDRPEREWLVVPDAGHWVQYEQAGAVNQVLLKWFASETS